MMYLRWSCVRLWAVAAALGLLFGQAALAQTAAVSPVTNATPEAGSLHVQGKAHFEKRDYAKAIELYTKALAISPRYADALQDRGIAQMAKGDFTAAVSDYGKALEIFGPGARPRTRTDLHIDRARALTRLGRTPEALADFAAAERVSGVMGVIHAQRAFTQLRAGALDAAIADGIATLRFENYSAAAMLARAVQAAVAARQKRYDDADRFLRDAIDRTSVGAAVAGIRATTMLGTSFDDPLTVRIVRLASPTCEPECPEWISIQGRIARGSEDLLSQALGKVGQKKLPVLIESPGGNIDAGMAMGRMIRARELDVAVARTDFEPPCGSDKACQARTKGGRVLGSPSNIGAMCSSSCVYLLAAGEQRVVGPVSLIGVHQISFFKTYREPPSEEQKKRDQRAGRIVVAGAAGPRLLGATSDEIYVKTRTYYRDMGIEDGLMQRLLSAPSTSMAWLTPAELVATRLMTATGVIEQLLEGRAPPPAVVTLAAPKAVAPLGRPELIAALNHELRRLGCLAAGLDDKDWTSAARNAMSRYSNLTGTKVQSDAPSLPALATLRNHFGVACPAICPVGTVERESFCVKADAGK